MEKRKVGRPKKLVESKYPILALLDRIKEKQEAKENLMGFLQARNNPDEWRGVIATPPGGLLQAVVNAFDKETDIPLEIPFISAISMVAGKMLENGNYLRFGGSVVKPDLWTILLASSGAGKTFASSALQRDSGYSSEFPEAASSAAFVETLSKHNNSLWIRDEIGQFIKNIETIPHLQEMKDYLLRTADGKRIERTTKKEQIVIENPALVLLGLTVLETFDKVVTPEMLLDGFAQRFNLIIAERDKRKDPRNYAIYHMDRHSDRIKREFDAVFTLIQPCTEFTLGCDAEDAFSQGFSMLFKENLPLSFYRRVMYRGVKYALVYHLLLKKSSTIIDAEDIGWGARLCALHLKDAGKVLEDHGAPELERMVKRVDELRKRLVQEGSPFTAREVVRNVHGISSVSEAKAIMSLL